MGYVTEPAGFLGYDTATMKPYVDSDYLKYYIGQPLAGDDGLDNEFDDPMDRELEEELEKTHPVTGHVDVPSKAPAAKTLPQPAIQYRHFSDSGGDGSEDKDRI